MTTDEIRITLGWLAHATGGRVVTGNPEQVIGQIATDTRRLQPGDFFVALRGSNFDGHTFVDEAFASGALGAMVDAGYDGTPPLGALVRGTDSMRGLQDVAHAVRILSKSRVIAITGSAGKTTTKEVIADFASTNFRVVKNKGNLNNHIGLPISLLQLREKPDVAVVELGMNHAGEIRRLVEISQPDVRVWTNVGDAHLGFFSSLEEIARAKAEILEGAKPNSLLVCNADDSRVMQHIQSFPGKIVTFGTAKRATVRATDIEDRGLNGTRARLVTPMGECNIQTPLLGHGNLSNLLAATAVALELGVELNNIVAKAAEFHALDRRGVVHKTPSGVILIDDSYNSSPFAFQSVLDVIAHDTTADRKIAVIGEMLELGERAITLHEECGQLIAAAGLDSIFTVGGVPARALAAAAISSGMSPDSVTYVENSKQAADLIAKFVRPGDLVLVKGSRGISTDLVADRILRQN